MTSNLSPIITALAFLFLTEVSWASPTDKDAEGSPSSFSPQKQPVRIEPSYPKGFPKPKSLEQARDVLEMTLTRSQQGPDLRTLVGAGVDLHNFGEGEMGLSMIRGALRQTSPRDPHFWPSRGYEALLCIQQGREEEAAGIYYDILNGSDGKLKLVASDGKPMTAGEHLLGLVRSSFEEGDFERSLRITRLLQPGEGTTIYSAYALFYLGYITRELAFQEPSPTRLTEALGFYDLAIAALTSHTTLLPAEEDTMLTRAHFLSSAYEGRGRILFEQEEWEAASDAYFEAIAARGLSPRSEAQICDILGRTFVLLGRFEDAVTWLKKSMAVSWRGTDLARIYNSLGYAISLVETETPVERLKESCGWLQRSSETEGCTLELHKKNWLFTGNNFAGMGRSLVSTGRNQEGLSCYEHAIIYYQKLIDEGLLSTTEKAQTHQIIGAMRSEQAQTLVETSPPQAIAYFLMSNEAYELGLGLKDVGPFTKALIHHNMGLNFKKIGELTEDDTIQAQKYSTAEIHFSRAILEESWTGKNRRDTYLNHAFVLIGQRKTDEAMPRLRTYLKEETDESARQYALSLLAGCHASRLNPTERDNYIRVALNKYDKHQKGADSTLEEDVAKLEGGEPMGEWFLISSAGLI